MSARAQPYPHLLMYTVGPDPKRKTGHLVVGAILGPRGPVELYCTTNCVTRGKADAQGVCHHTGVLMERMKPWWRSRVRISAGPARRPSGGAGGAGG